MRVLLLIPSLGSGGAERQLVTLAVLLKKNGFDIEFLIYHQEYFFKDILDENLINVNIVKAKNNFQRVLKVRQFIKKFNSEVVISFLETADFINCISSIGGGDFKVITTELSSNPSTFNTYKGKLFGLFRRYSDYIICNSNNALKLWSYYYPSYIGKLDVIYNPVLLPKITSEYIYRKNKKLNLVVAASYQYLKNPIGLINAVILLDENFRKKLKIDWYGRIEVTTGDTKAYDEAIALIQNNNLHEVITLHPPTKEIANIMNSADVVGLFSELEGLPNAICEAMMIGKPIIMTKVSDYDLLVDESNGILCDWNNPESIKFALEKMLKLDELSITEMGKSSKNKAEKLFSSEKIVKQWTKFLYNE